MQLWLFEKKEKRKRNRVRGVLKSGGWKEMEGGREGKGGALYTGGIFQSSADLKPLGDSFDFNLGCFFENYDRGPRLLH